MNKKIIKKIRYSLALLFVMLPLFAFADDESELVSADYSNSFIDPVSLFTYFLQPDGKTCWAYVLNNYHIDENGNYVLNGVFEQDSVCIPSKVLVNDKYYDVVGIASNCFSNTYRLKIKRVFLPESVKYIATYGFLQNDNITEIHAPGVTHIGMRSLAECHNLKVIDMPKLKYLSEMSVMYCTSLDSISLPSAVGYTKYSNGFQVFGNDTSLQYVYAPKLEVLEDQEFFRCKKLRRLDFPSVKHITHKSTSGLLFEVAHLDYLSLPNLVDPVINGTLTQVPNSTPTTTTIDTLLIPKVKTFQPYALPGIKKLDIRSVVADSVIRTEDPSVLRDDPIDHIVCHDASILYWLNYQQKVNYQNFYNHAILHASYYPFDYRDCQDYPGFETVELTNQTEMVDTAFMHIPRVKHLVLHEGCTAYNPKAFFNYLKNLEDITVVGNSETFQSDNGVLYSKDYRLLYYPLKNESIKRPWHIMKYISGVGPYALYNYVGLDPKDGNGHHELHIGPNDIDVNIGEHAFDGSTVDRVTFDPKAPVKAVGDYAFANMTEPAFQYLKFPTTLTSIGKRAFYGDAQMQAIELYDSKLTAVPDSAFAGLTTITSIGLPNSVETIGSNAFDGNEKMEYFTVPQKCTSIGADAFKGTALAMLNIQDANDGLNSSLAAAFPTAPEKIFLPEGQTVSLSGSTLTQEQSVLLEKDKFYSFTRSYPVDLSDATSCADAFIVSNYNVDAVSQKGVLYTETLNKEQLRAVPANTPIILRVKDSATSPYIVNYRILDAEPESIGRSLVKGAPCAIRIDNTANIDGYDYNSYVLQWPTSGDDLNGVFVPVTAKDWTEISTRKGEQSYLQLMSTGDGDEVAPAKYFTLDVSTTPTGITTMPQNNVGNNDVWYNLQGQRVSKPGHGVYIHNGKKIAPPLNPLPLKGRGI